MKIPLVDLKAQYPNVKEEIILAIRKIIKNTDFVLGEEVRLFEEEFASYCQVKYGVGVGSGTAALCLALLAFGIGPGDEVITVANTFVATALAISYTGAKPVLVDINPGNYNMDPSLVRKAITRRSKAIIPVHLFGHPADMDYIMEIAREYDLKVIEDVCQSHGAKYKDQKVGSFGDLSCFSFYPIKNLGAYGDGGIILTGNKKIAKKLRMLRNYGQKRKYYYDFIGYNSRLDEIQAAILRVKLKYLDEWNEARREKARCYSILLRGIPEIVLPYEDPLFCPVYHLYVIRAKKRNRLQEYLSSQGITTLIHYPIPVHLQRAFRNLGYQKGDFPITERYAGEFLSLPIFPEITKRQINYVADKIIDFFS